MHYQIALLYSFATATSPAAQSVPDAANSIRHAGPQVTDVLELRSGKQISFPIRTSLDFLRFVPRRDLNTNLLYFVKLCNRRYNGVVGQFDCNAGPGLLIIAPR